MLKALPEEPYRLRKGKQVTVQQNYAIQLPDNKHYYTVPYPYVGCKVWVQFDNKTVEVYYQHERIAFHVRSSYEPLFNRIAEHMPANHQHMLKMRGWTVEDLLQRAGWRQFTGLPASPGQAGNRRKNATVYRHNT